MKISNNISKNLILIIGLIFLAGCSKPVKNDITEVSDKIDIHKYISISTTSDYIEPAQSEINIYDESMKIVDTKQIDSGSYYSYMEKENKMYFFGGKSILSIDKTSGKLKTFNNIIDKGIIENINNQGDSPLFINNIELTSKNVYNSEIHEILDLNDMSQTSFKTNDSLALDAIKISNKYYVISRNFKDDENNRVLEIYDTNQSLINEIPLDFDSSIYQFYKKNDKLYLIGSASADEKIKIININEDLTLSLINELDIDSSEIFIDQSNQELYILNNSGVHKIDIEQNIVITIFDTKQFDSSNQKDNEYAISAFFGGNGKSLRVIKRSNLEPEKQGEVKTFIQDESKDKFIVLDKVSIDRDSINKGYMMGIYFGKLN